MNYMKLDFVHLSEIESKRACWWVEELVVDFLEDLQDLNADF